MTNQLSHTDPFNDAFGRCPLVAILRGVRPGEVRAIGEALVEVGIVLIEIPLNSPEPLLSIELLAKHLANRAVVGAGTVIRAEDVSRIDDAGGRLVIAPNTDVRVIAAASERGMVALPGFATPTEAVTAITAGAAALKLFPAEGFTPAFLKASLAVLPQRTRVLPTGGILPETMGRWRSAGAAGFGLGSALYSAGMTHTEVRARGQAFVTAHHALSSGSSCGPACKRDPVSGVIGV